MTLQRTLNETLAIERREGELGICLTNRWTVPFARSRTGPAGRFSTFVINRSFPHSPGARAGGSGFLLAQSLAG
jgi:hypothetical protein